MSDRPILYLARMDVAAEFLAHFEDWYARKHAPDLIESGFISCAAYHAEVGSPLVHNVYEIGDVEVFRSHAYQAARTTERDPERPVVLGHVDGRSNTPYEQIEIAGDQDVQQPWLSTLLFETADASDTSGLKAWFESVVELLNSRGASSVRLCQRSGLHPANPSKDVPKWMLLATWGSREPLTGALGIEPPNGARSVSCHALRRTFCLRADGVSS